MNKAFSFERSATGKEEWLTPPEIIQSVGPFDLDPCAPREAIRPWPTAKQHYDEAQDGLSKVWQGRVWCNPPYGSKTKLWLNRLARHGNGIALVFARTETTMFFNFVWGYADAVFFFKGRIAFHHVTGERAKPAGAPSCLVAYGDQNVQAIKSAIDAGLLKGKLVIL